MKFLMRSLAIIFAATMFFFAAVAEDQQNIPANAWEQHSEGIALALILITKPESDPSSNSIQVYIKNSSKTEKTIYSQGNGEIRIFYLDDHNAEIPLRNYSDNILSYKGNTEIQPGGTFVKAFNLTQNELTLVKTHPVECTFTVYDHIEKKGGLIESSPRKLVGKT